MHRQSLGSQGSKIQIDAEKVEKVAERDADGDDNKAHKLVLKFDSRTHKFLHLIPILIIMSFFLLYLVSHNPSPTDLANMGENFEALLRPQDLMEIGDDLEQSLETRSHRSLQEIGGPDRQPDLPRSSPFNLHRKFADF